MAGADDRAIRLGRVGPDDWEGYRSIRLEMLLDTPDAFWFTHADEAGHTEDQWRAQIGRSWLLNAWLGDEVVGSVGLGTHSDPHDGDKTVLWGMYVSPRARGRNVGERLVRAVLDEARGRGVTEVFLDVTSENAPAIALYERCGFERTGRTQPHPRRADLHELEMVHHLAQ